MKEQEVQQGFAQPVVDPVLAKELARCNDGSIPRPTFEPRSNQRKAKVKAADTGKTMISKDLYRMMMEA